MIVRCPHCGLDMEAPPEGVGRRVRCPGCRQAFVCRVPRATLVDGPPETEGLVLEDEVSLASSPPAAQAPPAPARPEDALAELGKARPKSEVKPNPRQWYVMVEGMAAVALTFQELAARAAEGKVRPKDKIYYAPKDLTIAAREIPGLFPDLDARRPAAEAASRAGAPAHGSPEAEARAAEALARLQGPDRKRNGGR